MEETGFWGFVKEDIKKGYSLIFENTWPLWLGGIFMAILVLLFFLWNFPWGVTGGYLNWIEWLGYITNIKEKAPAIKPWLHPISVSNAGMLLGALGSALLGKQFKWQISSAREYLKGIIGGTLLGIGISMAGGCIGGAFYSGVGAFSMGAFTMMIGLIGGAYIGLKIVLWEINNLAPPKTQTTKKESDGFDWKKIQPILGILIFAAAILIFYVYSGQKQVITGGICFIGVLIGLVMHRSRFCFVRVFRCPLMTGDAEMVKTVCLSLLIYAAGAAVIKWSYLQPDTMGVSHPVGLGTLLGGFIFGIGMILMGSCGSSALWRIGEGNTKVMLGIFCLSVSFSVSRHLLTKFDLYPLLGKAYLVPNVLGWGLTLPLYAMFFLVWVLVANWNEETEKFVIF